MTREPLRTADEVAARLRKPRAAVVALARGGGIRAVRDGRRWLFEDAERLQAGRKWRKADLVFTTAAGQPVAESTAQWVLSEACKRAGVRHVKPHDLRRFYATTVTDAAGRDVAQRLLGHTTETMTDRYVSVTDAARLQASAALEEALA